MEFCGKFGRVTLLMGAVALVPRPAATQDVSLAEPLPAPPVVQNPSLALTISLDRSRVWPSEAAETVLLVQFQNLTNEGLRWHQPGFIHHGDVYQSRVCLQRTDGTRFLANGTGGDERGMHLGGEFTALLPPRQSAYVSGWVGWGARATEKWAFARLANPVTGKLEASEWKPLEVGEYDLWVEFEDGPILNGPQPSEPMPAFGLYPSNRVHLSVVPEGTAMAAAPRLRRGGLNGQIVNHRGTGLVRDGALSGYGISSRLEVQGVTLSRGRQRVTLPYRSEVSARKPVLSTISRAIQVPPLHERTACYVPLRLVAGKLGFHIRYDALSHLYDLQPHAAR